MLDRLDGKLRLQSLNLQIFFGDMFAKCKNEHEVEWLQEQLQECTEYLAEERLSGIESEDK